MKNSHDKVTIKIPRNLYQRINRILDDSGFDSATDFITYILRDLVSSREGNKNTLSPREIEIVKKRLKNLGYL